MTLRSARRYILSEAKRLDHAFTYGDLLEGAEGEFSYGALRNGVYRLKRDGLVLPMPLERPARFILKEWVKRPEYARWFKRDTTPMGGRVKVIGRQLTVDFASFVETLPWEELVHVHDVRAEFDAVCVDGVSSAAGWRWSPRSHSWRRKFSDLEFPLTVMVYDSGRVQVVVRCSLKPIPFSFEGLTRLTAVLGELKGRLGWSDVPNVVDWIVTSWHYGRDSRKEVSGASLNVTFETWSKTLARIYYKSELSRFRAEEICSPKRSVQDLFERIMSRDDEKPRFTAGV